MIDYPFVHSEAYPVESLCAVCLGHLSLRTMLQRQVSKRRVPLMYDNPTGMKLSHIAGLHPVPSPQRHLALDNCIMSSSSSFPPLAYLDRAAIETVRGEADSKDF